MGVNTIITFKLEPIIHVIFEKKKHKHHQQNYEEHPSSKTNPCVNDNNTLYLTDSYL